MSEDDNSNFEREEKRIAKLKEELKQAEARLKDKIARERKKQRKLEDSAKIIIGAMALKDKALAKRLAEQADPDHLDRIKKAYPELWDHKTQRDMARDDEL